MQYPLTGVLRFEEETLHDALNRVEGEILERALKYNEMNRRKTAKDLGIGLRTIYDKISKRRRLRL